ncbi:MAG: glucokinase [Gammaproteobacteria bacterium]
MMIPAPLLAVDVGGTHTKIRMVASADRSNVAEVQQVVRNRSDMLAFIDATLASHTTDKPLWCVVSAAGPVEDGERVRMTNWPAERQIALRDLKQVGIDTSRATIVNDMVVSAMGIVAHNVDSGGPDNWARRLAGDGATTVGGNMVVIMPGTGLGVAGVVHLGREPSAGYHVVPCEVQHTPIGAISTAQQRVAQQMRDRLGIARPSWEHFVCGHGLVRVHQMLCGAEAPLMEAGDIAKQAVAGNDAMCREALDLFYLCAGGIAQLTALSFLPDSGVYLSGRSSRLNAPFIETSQFVTELRNNDTHADLLDNFPVYLVTEDTNLDGGIFLARHHLSRQ